MGEGLINVSVSESIDFRTENGPKTGEVAKCCLAKKERFW